MDRGLMWSRKAATCLVAAIGACAVLCVQAGLGAVVPPAVPASCAGGSASCPSHRDKAQEGRRSLLAVGYRLDASFVMPGVAALPEFDTRLSAPFMLVTWPGDWLTPGAAQLRQSEPAPHGHGGNTHVDFLWPAA